MTTRMILPIFFLLVILTPCNPLFCNPAAEVNKLLDKFHHAATKADEKEYFGCLTDNAYYLGTAPEELWTKEEFRTYCKPYFSKGIGWTYIPKDRKITLSPDQKSAWFFEKLTNKHYGELRGSGTLILTPKGWRITQYNLSFAVPNKITREVVKLIQSNQPN